MTLVDYEGPNSAYVAGPQQGRAVIDSVRATLAFGSSIGLDSTAKVVMTGYSGGAIGVGWAEALLDTYAPELNVIGSATGGTPASLRPSFIQIVSHPQPFRRPSKVGTSSFAEQRLRIWPCASFSSCLSSSLQGADLCVSQSLSRR